MDALKEAANAKAEAQDNSDIQDFGQQDLVAMGGSRIGQGMSK